MTTRAEGTGHVPGLIYAPIAIYRNPRHKFTARHRIEEIALNYVASNDPVHCEFEDYLSPFLPTTFDSPNTED